LDYENKDLQEENMKFENKVAVVTGASSGIGRAISIALASLGATVIVNYSGNISGALEVIEEINSKGGDGETYKCDVSNYADVILAFR
jgi:NAD(P)-dependent dehydrogenase (short-subunit alcohol dehydrogenase family)